MYSACQQLDHPPSYSLLDGVKILGSNDLVYRLPPPGTRSNMQFGVVGFCDRGGKLLDLTVEVLHNLSDSRVVERIRLAQERA